jgi:hypothetical protein
MKLAFLVAVAAALTIGFGAAAGRAGLHASVVVPKCPAHAPKFEATLGTSTPFVRPNAQYIRLCRYYKNNWATGQTLWKQRTFNQKTILTPLTHAFNRLKEPPRGIFCVKDDGSEMQLIFAYSGSRPERVTVKLSGCRFASNGKAVRSTTSWLHKKLLSLSNSK